MLTRPIPANIVAAMRREFLRSPRAGASLEEQSQRINESIYKAFFDALAQLKGDPNFQKFYVVMSPVAALDSTFQIAANQNVQVLPQRPERQYLCIINIGSANAMNVSFGKPAAANQGIGMPINAFYEPARPITSSVNIFSSAGTIATVIEG